MKIRVLGCSGAIAQNCRTTSFLIDQHTLVDAGTGVGDLTLEQMVCIDHVFLTHSHLDHVAALPLMLDSCASKRTKPVKVYALPQTLNSLRAHIFNNVIWPDFTRIPSPDAPFVELHPIQVGQTIEVGDVRLEALPAVHTVPAIGYAVHGSQGAWVFSGDTERNPNFWHRINQMPVKMLVIETAFSDRERELAKLSLHLSPQTLAKELDLIDSHNSYPIYITHTKPSETALIMQQVLRFDETDLSGTHVRHDIRKLQAGQEFEL